jgi:hypothetical protein
MLRNAPKFAKLSALVGAVIWLIVAAIPTVQAFETTLITNVQLLAVLVIVPLGLSLVETRDRYGRHGLPYLLAVLLQPFGALGAVIAVNLKAGLVAASLASLWFVVTALIFSYGLWRLLPRGLHPVEEFSVDAGLFYLPVGGVWFILSRLGTQALGFGDTIVLLTAVHFHFAGFAAPILVGFAGRLSPRSRASRRLLRVTISCVVVGIPLVAIGITVSPIVGLIGTVTLSAGFAMLTLAVFGWVLPAVTSLLAKILLSTSSIAIVAAMLLAMVYSYSIVVQKLIIDIPQMALTHGLINAFGFALLGLIAWSIIKPPSLATPPGVPLSKLSAGLFTGSAFFHRVGGISESKPPALGLVDNFSIYRRADFDPESIHPLVRSFYEETFRYRLVVRPSWRAGFRLGGRVAHWLGAKVGQMRLPVSDERLGDRIESKLFPLNDMVDGRTGVRAWVRTYEGLNEAMYVAAYATHSRSENTYMNIAFPLLGGNISSILHISSIPDNRGSVSLSTLPDAHVGGDQGIYFANRICPIRLPMNETITVWANEMSVFEANQDAPVLKAAHRMWVCGILFLELSYEIFPSPPAGEKMQG